MIEKYIEWTFKHKKLMRGMGFVNLLYASFIILWALYQNHYEQKEMEMNLWIWAWTFLVWIALSIIYKEADRQVD